MLNVDLKDGVARVTLNRPDVRNAFDDALIAATRKLNQALADLSRALGADGSSSTIPETDRENLAKFLSIKRTHLDNLVVRLRRR